MKERLRGWIPLVLLGSSAGAALALESSAAPSPSPADGGISGVHRNLKRQRTTHKLKLSPPPINGTTLPPLEPVAQRPVAEREPLGQAAARENVATSPGGPVIPDAEPKLKTAVGDFGVMGTAPPDDTRLAHPTGLPPPPVDPHGATVPLTITYQPPVGPAPDAGDYGIKIVPKPKN